MRKFSVLSLFAVLISASFAVAQDFPEVPKPTKEHELLQQFVGDWETESSMQAGAGLPEMKCTGTMSAKMLGGFWLVSDNTGQMPGFEVKSMMTLGYDPAKKKYVGTWVDTMINHLWHYEGSVDETGKILTLEAEGPNFMEPGKTAKYQDIYEFKSADEIVVSSKVQGPDGKWITMMTGTAKRKAAK
jgi:hypothetical protein